MEAFDDTIFSLTLIKAAFWVLVRFRGWAEEAVVDAGPIAEGSVDRGEVIEDISGVTKLCLRFIESRKSTTEIGQSLPRQ